MTYFLRALRDASKSWPLLLAAFLCSAGVAGLWGANIAALFPVIEVTLNGESLQNWNKKRIADAESKIMSHEQEIRRLPSKSCVADPPTSNLQTSETPNLQISAGFPASRALENNGGTHQPTNHQSTNQPITPINQSANQPIHQ